MHIGQFLNILKETRSYWRNKILKGVEQIGNPAENREAEAGFFSGLLYCGCICMDDLVECVDELLCNYELEREADAFQNRCDKILNRLAERWGNHPQFYSCPEVQELVKAHSEACKKVAAEIVRSLNKIK